MDGEAAISANIIPQRRHKRNERAEISGRGEKMR